MNNENTNSKSSGSHTQGGSHEQHVEAGRKGGEASHGGGRSSQSSNRENSNSGTQGGSREQHAEAGRKGGEASHGGGRSSQSSSRESSNSGKQGGVANNTLKQDVKVANPPTEVIVNKTLYKIGQFSY